MARLAVLGALLASLVVAWESLYPFVVPRSVWFRSFVAIGATATGIVVLRHRARVQAGGDLFGLGLILFLMVSIAAAALGVAPTRSFFGDLERMGGVLSLLHVAVFYVLLRTVFGTRDWEWLVQILSVVGGILALSAILEWRVFAGAAGELRPDGLLGNPGYVGGLMLLVAPLAVVAAVRARPYWRIAHVLVVPLALLALFATVTRGALLGAAAGTATALLAWGWKRSRRAGILLTILLVLGVGAIAWALVDKGLPETSPAPRASSALSAVDRIRSSGPLDGSISFRLMTWSIAAEAIGDRWILGWGPENETQAISAHTPPRYYSGPHANQRIDRSHNVVLDVLLTTGVVGLMAYLLVWAGLLLGLAVAWRRKALSDIAAAALLAGVVGHAVYLLFWFHDLTSWIYLTAVAAMVVTLGSGRPLMEVGVPHGRSRRWLSGLIGLLAVAFVWAQSLQPLLQARRLHEAETATQAEVRLERFEQALRAGATQKLQAVLRHQSFLERLYSNPRVRGDRQALTRTLRSSEIGLAALVNEIERDPRNDLLYSRLSNALARRYEATGDTAALRSALAAVQQARELAPGKIRYDHHLARIYLMAGDTARARGILDATLDRYTAYGETYLMRGVVSHATGNPSEAAHWLLEAARQDWRFSGPEAPLDIAESLRLQDPALAASVLEGYLASRYPLFAADTIPSGSTPTLLSEDIAVLNRIPLLWLSAGMPERARVAAATLSGQEPAIGGMARRLIQQTRQGVSAEAWPHAPFVVDSTLLYQVSELRQAADRGG